MLLAHRNSLQPHQELNWYRIKGVLGQGGFGITYLAHDKNLNVNVAIKEYLPPVFAVRDSDNTVRPVSSDTEQDYQKGLERFIEEARTLAKFEHPSIVRVISVFEQNNTAYMVMAYEPGETFLQRIESRRNLSEEFLLRLLIPILDGLQLVHNSGFIHRDIKPANIIIRDNGTGVLLDFGSSRYAAGANSNPLTAIVTAGYAPIELYRSESRDQGPWSDIYSLGATLYHAVCGSPPISAIDRSTGLQMPAQDELIKACEIGSGRYSDRLLRAIDNALEFRPSNRPQSVGDWMATLVEPGEFDLSPPHYTSPGATAPYTPVDDFAEPLWRPKTTKIDTVWVSTKLPESRGTSGRSLLVQVILIAIVIAATAVMWRFSDHIMAHLGSNQAKYELARRYYKGEGLSRDFQAAARWFTSAAEAGNADAQMAIGLMHAEGLGVEQDNARAVEWYRKAAAQGSAKAQNNLGYMFENGLGVERDIRDAFIWYEMAASHGYSPAQYNVGVMYSLGRGVEVDHIEAFKWYRDAAAQGDVDAHMAVGNAYSKGLGVPVDVAEAIRWYRKAIDLGSVAAIHELGVIHKKSGAAAGYDKEAFDWYRDAAQQGNAQAQYFLGLTYDNGDGVAIDHAAALRWYRESADGGDAAAQVTLGFNYSVGDGVPQDAEEAVISPVRATGKRRRSTVVGP